MSGRLDMGDDEDDVIGIEEKRLYKHAGNVVYQEPAAPEKRVDIPEHATLRECNAGLLRFLRKTWNDGCASRGTTPTHEVYRGWQVRPTKDMLEDFEFWRNQLDARIAPQECQTRSNMFFAPSETQLKTTLDKSFDQAIGLRAAFSSDPEQALREGNSAQGKVLVCRVVLAPGVSELNGKLIVEDTRGVMPGFICLTRKIQREDQK